MTGMNRRRWMAFGTSAFAGGALVQGPSSAIASSRGSIQARYFPNVPLITHDGRKVRFYDDLIKNRMVIINFMYATCEGACPLITSNLRNVQKLLGDRVGRDIFMYSLNLKTKQDTPAVLNQHVEMHGIGPGWLFLTGRAGDVERLRRSLGFVDSDPQVDKDKSQHIGMVRYGNEPLQLWAACPGLATPEWIARSICWVNWPRVSAI